MKRSMAVLLGMVATMAHADQISVLSGGAAKSFIEPLAKTFPGHTVKLEFQPIMPDANVGSRILKDFRLSFDTKNKRIRFARAS